MKKDADQKLAVVFKEQKCWMIEPLAQRMKYSVPSVRRFLAETGYYSSFTHNGRWYTLASIPRFGNDGLWFHKEIGFSRTGSLTHTLISLVEHSAAGMSADQLGEKLRCRCHAVLVQLYRKGRLQRQKHGRSYVYLAADEQTASAQCRVMQKPCAPRLPAEIAVLVLAEFIRTPEAGFRQLAKAISRRTGMRIEGEQIRVLFEQHGLKKTA
ncbi:MAG: hypothetical protein WCS56_05520 [Bacilli bacterium]